MEFEGYVSRIVYQNSENGYSVIALELTGQAAAEAGEEQVAVELIILRPSCRWDTVCSLPHLEVDEDGCGVPVIRYEFHCHRFPVFL